MKKHKHKSDYEVAKKLENDVPRETLENKGEIQKDTEQRIKDMDGDNGHLLDTEDEDDGGFDLFVGVTVLVCILLAVVVFISLFFRSN